ncbi:YlxR family protein [Mycoplasma todarodis]
MKKNNQRTCIATGQKFDKSELIRVVKFNGEYSVDKEHNLPGRGAYFKKDKDLVKTIKTKKLLHRAFKEQVSEMVYEELIKYIEEE